MPGPWEMALILAVVLLIFGSKKLKTLGTDLGDAIKGFRSSMGAGKDSDAELATEPDQAETVEASEPQAKTAE